MTFRHLDKRTEKWLMRLKDDTYDKVKARQGEEIVSVAMRKGVRLPAEIEQVFLT